MPLLDKNHWHCWVVKTVSVVGPVGCQKPLHQPGFEHSTAVYWTFLAHGLADTIFLHTVRLWTLTWHKDFARTHIRAYDFSKHCLSNQFTITVIHRLEVLTNHTNSSSVKSMTKIRTSFKRIYILSLLRQQKEEHELKFDRGTCTCWVVVSCGGKGCGADGVRESWACNGRSLRPSTISW